MHNHRVCILTAGVRSKVHTDSQVDSTGTARRSLRLQFSMSICSRSRFRCNVDHQRLHKGQSDSVIPMQLRGLLQLAQPQQQHPLWPRGGRRRKRCCPKCRWSDVLILKIMDSVDCDATTCVFLCHRALWRLFCLRPSRCPVQTRTPAPLDPEDVVPVLHSTSRSSSGRTWQNRARGPRHCRAGPRSRASLSRLAARGDRDICLRRPGARTMVGRSVARGVERVEKVKRTPSMSDSFVGITYPARRLTGSLGLQ